MRLMNTPTTRTTAIRVTSATPEDYLTWHRLWCAYTKYFGTDLSDAITAHTWQRILDPESRVSCRIAKLDGQVAGFAVLVLHDGTWTNVPICYLEDLYVDELQRSRGVGRALLDDVIELAKDQNWSRLYWHTKSANAAARQLYDSYIDADPFVRYRIVFDDMKR